MAATSLQTALPCSPARGHGYSSSHSSSLSLSPSPSPSLSLSLSLQPSAALSLSGSGSGSGSPCSCTMGLLLDQGLRMRPGPSRGPQGCCRWRRRCWSAPRPRPPRRSTTSTRAARPRPTSTRRAPSSTPTRSRRSSSCRTAVQHQHQHMRPRVLLGLGLPGVRAGAQRLGRPVLGLRRLLRARGQRQPLPGALPRLKQMRRQFVGARGAACSFVECRRRPISAQLRRTGYCRAGAPCCLRFRRPTRPAPA